MPEKIQQIVDSAIWPSPVIDISVIADPSDSARGVVITTVPPSPLAPHYANTRFPARSGTTTRYLDEREIAAFYEQRRALLASAEEAEVLSGHIDPPDAPSGVRGVAMLRMVVAPLAPVRHPRGVYLGRPLADSVKAAKESLAWLTQSQPTAAFDFLDKGWAPRGSVGWQAGEMTSDFPTLQRVRTAAAACTHGLTLSFLTTLGLQGEDGEGFCAYEQIWVAEALAFLAVAGHFFTEVPGATMMRADVSMQGLEGSVSWALSHGLAFNENQLRAVDTDYRERTRMTANEARSEPVDVARRLLDRLLVSFAPQETDVFVRLKSTV